MKNHLAVNLTHWEAACLLDAAECALQAHDGDAVGALMLMPHAEDYAAARRGCRKLDEAYRAATGQRKGKQ
jgi:hypothetical protein